MAVPNAARTSEDLLATSVGEGRLVTHHPALEPGTRPRAEVLLSHGAGGGIDAADLEALAEVLPGSGYRVHLLEQPWRRAGRKIATPPATLDVGLRAAETAVRALPDAGPVVLGGRSAGARSACRCAAESAPGEVLGVLALSFPLHPPGRPEKSRLPELLSSGVPTLVVQGARDPMGRPEEFPAVGATGPWPDGLLVEVPDADHSLRVPKRSTLDAAAVGTLVATSVAQWLADLLA